MSVVVDASVLIAVLIHEDEKNRLVTMTRGEHLMAPHSVHWEIGNAFSAMMKRKRIKLDDALAALGIYEKIVIKYLDVNMKAAMKIADQHQIYAYDSYLIQCSLQYKMPLITLDDKLKRAAQNSGCRVMEV